MELHDDGRPLAERWRLQQDMAVPEWQPVTYSRPPQTRTNWILPSLVGITLAAVVSYMVWIGITRLSPNIATLQTIPDPQATPTSAALEEGATDNTAPEEAAPPPIEDPTNTPPVPTNTSEPTPTTAPTEEPSPTPILVEQRIATIANQFGVNARLEPSLTGEILRILEQNETAVVLDEREDAAIEGNWLQVRTSEGALAWISSQFAEVSTQFVVAEPGSAEAIAAVNTPASREIPGLDVRVTISSPAGLNARSAPDATAEIVTILPNNRSYRAVSRSDDGQWIQVELEDGTLGWIFLQLVISSNDLNNLPIEGQEEPTPVPPTLEPTPTTAAETAIDPVTAPVTDTVPAPPLNPLIVVSNTFGVNARATIGTDSDILTILENGTELPAIGRTADTTWLQVELDDGRVAWVFTAAVLTTDEVNDLPVVEPPVPGTSVAPTTTITQTETVTTTEPLTDTAPVTETQSIAPTEELTSTQEVAPSTDLTTTTPVTTTEPITPTDSVTDTSATPEGATATIVSLLGANARPSPGTEEAAILTLANGTQLTAIGRIESGQWIAVVLEDGSQAWLFAQNVELNVDLEALPILEN